MAEKKWLGISTLILMAGLAWAAPAPPPATLVDQPPAQPAASAPADQPAGDQLRDPFWPVGYVPATKMVSVRKQPIAEQSASGAVLESCPGVQAQLQLGGIIQRGTNYLATLNGTLVEVGDQIPLLLDGQWVFFTVSYINLTRVRIAPTALAP